MLINGGVFVNNKKDFLDVDYEELTDVNLETSVSNSIRGSDNIRYSATQVADMYGIPVSKVRYYMKCFEDILDLEFSNKMRRFTYSSLKKFDYIIKLKDDGMTVQQILEYCENDDVFTKDTFKTPDNPLTVEMLAKAISIQVENLMNSFKEQVIEEVVTKINETNSEFKEDLITTIDEVVSEKLEVIDDIEKNISNKISQVEESLSKREDNLDLYFSEIKEKMESMEEKQDKIAHTASLSLEQVQKQMYERKSWLEKLVDKIKDRIE